MAQIDRALSLLATTEEEMPETLQQLVHMHVSCDGLG
jgi:hypothetical protein